MSRLSRRVGTVQRVLVLLVVIFYGLFTAAFPTPVHAATTIFSPVADTYLRQDSPTSNYGSATDLRVRSKWQQQSQVNPQI